MVKKDIEEFLAPLISNCGCELWGIEFDSVQGKGRLRRIYIDASTGVAISECDKYSKEIDY